jgi:lipopolysaccharide heptosyltransferase III
VRGGVTERGAWAGLRILFITASRIGDAVLSTGLLAHLLEQNPAAAATVAAGPVALPLFRGVPRLERLIPLVRHHVIGHWAELYREVATARWDWVVDLRGSAFAYLLPFARHRRVAERRNPNEHQIRQLARLLDLEPPPAPRLWLLPEHEAAAAALVPKTGPVLAIGPAANWRAKQWRDMNFATLAQRLTATGGIFAGAPVVVLAAANERGQAQALLEAVPASRRIDLVGRVDLLTAAAVLKRCAMFIGNDTGLTHIAAAMGTATLALFGPGSVVRYGPWGERTAVVTTPEPPDVLMSRPGFHHRTADTLMDSLTVDAVAAAAAELRRRFPDDLR